MGSLFTAPLQPIEIFLIGLAIFVSALGFVLTRKSRG